MRPWVWGVRVATIISLALLCWFGWDAWQLNQGCLPLIAVYVTIILLLSLGTLIQYGLALALAAGSVATVLLSNKIWQKGWSSGEFFGADPFFESLMLSTFAVPNIIMLICAAMARPRQLTGAAPLREFMILYGIAVLFCILAFALASVDNGYFWSI